MRPDHRPAPVPPRPPLDAAALRRALVASGGLWTSLEVVERTGSTNADLAAAARAGAGEGAVLVAEHQYQGRGRAGRTWSSPPRAGIAVSVLLRPAAGPPERPAVPAARWGWLPLLAGVALVEAVAAAAGLTAHLKWPNDLLVGGGKCAGILAESGADAVVLGIGVNVTQHAGELPPAAPGAATGDAPPAGVPATSLALAGAPGTDRLALLSTLLVRLESWYARWCGSGGEAGECGLRAAYLAASATVGRPVRVLLPGGGELAGQAGTVDSDGRLVVRTPDGVTRTVAAGDVLHLR